VVADCNVLRTLYLFAAVVAFPRLVCAMRASLVFAFHPSRVRGDSVPQPSGPGSRILRIES